MFAYMSSFGSNPLCSYSRRQNAIRRKKDNQEKNDGNLPHRIRSEFVGTR